VNPLRPWLLLVLLLLPGCSFAVQMAALPLMVRGAGAPVGAFTPKGDVPKSWGEPCKPGFHVVSHWWANRLTCEPDEPEVKQ
jgi:hypothetical protein